MPGTPSGRPAHALIVIPVAHDEAMFLAFVTAFTLDVAMAFPVRYKLAADTAEGLRTRNVELWPELRLRHGCGDSRRGGASTIARNEAMISTAPREAEVAKAVR